MRAPLRRGRKLFVVSRQKPQPSAFLLFSPKFLSGRPRTPGGLAGARSGGEEMWGGGSSETAGDGGRSALLPISHEKTADAGDLELGDEARVRDEAVAADISESPGDGEAELRPLSGGSSRPVWSVWSRGTVGGPGTSGSALSAAYRRPTTGGSASSGATCTRSRLVLKSISLAVANCFAVPYRAEHAHSSVLLTCLGTSTGARSARSVLPGETDNEDEEDLLVSIVEQS